MQRYGLKVRTRLDGAQHPSSRSCRAAATNAAPNRIRQGSSDSPSASFALKENSIRLKARGVAIRRVQGIIIGSRAWSAFEAHKVDPKDKMQLRRGAKAARTNNRG